MKTAGRVVVTAVVALTAQGVLAQPVEPECAALWFDGENDYVEMPHSQSIKPPLPITICAWIKPASVGTYQWIVQLDDRSSYFYGVAFYVRYNGTLVCSMYDGGPQSGSHRRSKVGQTALSSGEWHHVAVVLRGPTDISLYIDGVDDGGTYSGTGGALAYTDTGSSFIGSDSGVLWWFDGTIDEVVVYERALSLEEIRANMGQQLSGEEDGLVGYWAFDEGEGQVTGDSSGNGNDGQLGSSGGADGHDPNWVACEMLGPTVFSPNGGEMFRAWETCGVRWDNYAYPAIDEVAIEYSDDNGGNWHAIESRTDNDGEYDWLVPDIASSAACLIRVSDANDPNHFDVSDDVFTILEYWWPYPACWDYAAQCHGDYNEDDDVDTVDWPTFRDGFGRFYPHPIYTVNACADHDRDGDIDTVDWPHFRDNFGGTPAADCPPGDINRVHEP